MTVTAKVIGALSVLVLVLAVCLLLVVRDRNKIAEEKVELAEKVEILSNIVVVANRAMTDRDRKLTEIRKEAVGKKDELAKISQGAAAMSDDELFFRLHGMCVKDGTCTDSPADESAR